MEAEKLPQFISSHVAWIWVVFNLAKWQLVSRTLILSIQESFESSLMRGNDCLGKISTSGHVGVDLFSCRCAAGTSRASGDGRRGKRGMRWTTRGRGTCWPATVTPPLWPSLTSGSMWSVGRRFYIGKTSKPQACGFEFKQQMCSTCYSPVCLSWICSYEVQLESRVRRKGLGKFLIQILQLIANR